MELSTIGIDLSKSIYHIVGSSRNGNVILRKKCKPGEILSVLNTVDSECSIYMEASGGAHHLCRQLGVHGYKNVRQISPQFVKPFVKSQKNDFNDAEAISEAGSRSNMRFVATKSLEQQELQSIHKVRERLVRSRTRLINQVRAIFAEQGIRVALSRKALRERLMTLEDVPQLTQRILQLSKSELFNLDTTIQECENMLLEVAKQSYLLAKISRVPGLGIISGTALACFHGNLKEFKNGRCFAAWIGLVPKQCSTGGKPKLVGMTKRGNRYLRQLLIHGARSVINAVGDKTDPHSLWIKKQLATKHKNLVAVSVANKNARVVWKLLTSDTTFDTALMHEANLSGESYKLVH